MDQATKVQLAGALFVGVIPTACVVAIGWGATRRSGRYAPRPLVAGLALTAGLIAAYLGVAGWNPQESHRWVLFGLAFAAIGGLGLDVLAPGKIWPSVALGAVILGFVTWRILAPLKGVWMEGGAVVQLATKQWGIEPALWGLVVWTVVGDSARRSPAPATLGPIALACVGAAVVTGVTGSLLIAQLLAAFGVAAAALGFLGWWRPALQPGLGATAALLTAFIVTVVYAHFYVDVPRPVMGLILAAPLAGFAGTAAGATWRRVAFALALAALPVGTGVWLAWQADQAAQAEQAEDDGPDYGSYY